MRTYPVALLSLAITLLLLGLFHFADAAPTPSTTMTSDADQLMRRQPGCFVANLGQWDRRTKFLHRSGPATMFLEDRGWVIDMARRPAECSTEQTVRGVRLRMTFEGDTRVPEIVGETQLAGNHNYFIGNESQWRTGVPRYASVRYRNLYAGIDLRLREANGVTEYDLLLQPGADLSIVTVRVEGVKALRLTDTGSLVVDTAVGPMEQTAPKTWQETADRGQREVTCNFTLLGADRFGFAADAWDGDTSLTIDPGLIWSTFIGGRGSDQANAVSIDISGVVTIAGTTFSADFPTTSGAFDRTHNGRNFDAFVSRLDPSKTGTAQLVYSTFLGGNGLWPDLAAALDVDGNGVVTVVGLTASTDFPTTSGAFSRTHNGGTFDAFVSRLDPSKTGTAQLVYSTYLGGGGGESAVALAVDGNGDVIVAGSTTKFSTGFPTTVGAYDRTHNGANDAFVSRLDPSKIGIAQLVYSTLLGGSAFDAVTALAVDASGVMTVGGSTVSANFPTTSSTYDTTHNGGEDVFLSRLDPNKTGSAQLIYSTFLGGTGRDVASALTVDPNGVATVTGETQSTGFPTTNGAFDTTHNGPTSGSSHGDAFVSRLDPNRVGSSQLVYSTFLGGTGSEAAVALSVDADGVATVTGKSSSTDFPTTADAHDTTHNGAFDVFVSRIDPSRIGAAQLDYSTYVGGSGHDSAQELAVDFSGTVTVAGQTGSSNYPTTSGAYNTVNNGNDVLITHLDMGVALYADVHRLSLRQAGTQRLTLNAGKQHAGKSYWIFGSSIGTKPGVRLGGLLIPLVPDAYTDFTIASPNSTTHTNTLGTLDSQGTATASISVPSALPPHTDFTLYHAYVIYDGQGTFYMASNAVPLQLKN